MGAPERLRDRIGLVGGDAVGDGGGRAVRLPAAAVEPAQALVQAGQPQADERDGGGEREQREDDEPDGAAERRQHAPQAGPGERQEQAERGQ